MSLQPTSAAEVQGLANEAVKQALGMTPDELRQMHADWKAAKDQDDTVRRRFLEDKVESELDPSYRREAASVLRQDKHKGVGLRLGALVRAYYHAETQRRNVKDVAAQMMGYKWLADDIDQAEQLRTKTPLLAQTFSAGGAFVPPAYSEEAIELLRAQSVLRMSGVPSYPMPAGTLTIPRQATAASASYTNEGSNITASFLTTEQISLATKKLTALTVLSNDLIRFSSPKADELARNDLMKVMSLKEDITLLRTGDGTQYQPKSVLTTVTSSNQFAATQAGTYPTLAEVTNDLFRAMGLPGQSNVTMTRPAWYMHWKTAIGLRRIRDSFGNLVFDQEMRGGTLLGVPYYVSNQLPTNLGSGSNKTEVYFLETSMGIIGDAYAMEIAVFPNGSYHDGSAVQSGISQDLTVIRSIAGHDFALQHDVAGAVINTVAWGNA